MGDPEILATKETQIQPEYVMTIKVDLDANVTITAKNTDDHRRFERECTNHGEKYCLDCDEQTVTIEK